MKKILSMILCVALLASMFVLPVFAVESNPFTDVKEKDYFYDPVLWAVANGITTGTSKTTFSPEKPCTRAQVVTFLWRAAGSPEPSQTDNPFTDVPAGQYYYKAVLWAVEEGITTGTSKTTFGPDKSCTRAQVVTFLWRAAGEPAPEKNDNPFTDVPAGQYYYNAVLWAVGKGITTGTSKTTFGPDKPCTRGQIVTFIYRYMTSEEPLAIVFQPEDYQMTSSQEDAEFSVTIKGGSAPYT
ncbi:MAG: S-layer homology domain-containing protein, partial [Oscillospiraceae bacterium]|nr:S-layer homology domain-containing protein [Oscillospiraceae bacterium]